ncbi:MAG: hypothetical protein Q9159_004999 [Coniocarpon cinnabarinum]
MPLKLEPLNINDFEVMSHYKFNHDGDLIAPLVHRFWPHSEDDEVNSARNAWSLKQQREIFEEDSSVRFMKVIDTDKNNEILSLARWHCYENGYKHPEFTAFELNGTHPDADERWPEAANVPLAKAVLIPLLEARPQWMGQRPMWVLTTIMTRAPHRQRGAGGMLIKWGVDKARSDNVPAFLEAVAERVPLYEKFGFRRIGDTTLDLREHGFDQPVVLQHMAANLP